MALATDIEYWVLIDPKTNTWKQVGKDEVGNYSVSEVRYTKAIPRSAIDQLLYDSMQQAPKKP